MFTVVSTRFTDTTWCSCELYKERKNFSCIYSSPFKIGTRVDLNSPLFVIEMNNSINKIMGIGLIRNKLETEKIYRIYDNPNYNRYVYIGKHHITRETLNEYNPRLVEILDIILFKGYTHSKRCAGFTKIPPKVLQTDLCKEIDINKEIKNIFINYYSKKENPIDDLLLPITEKEPEKELEKELELSQSK